MKGYIEQLVKGKDVFVGVDVHIRDWKVAIRTEDDEITTCTIAGKWEALRDLLSRYKDSARRVRVAYEAGYSGFWLWDRLVGWGCECIVTPPSRIPQEAGNRVKTDRKDCKKLAYMLAKGMLKEVYVPTKQERHHRQVVRTRRQLVRHCVRVQSQIKALARFYGIELPERHGKWTKTFVENLWRLDFGDHYTNESFRNLLRLYEETSKLVDKQTELLKELAQTELYRERVEILTSAPGIGDILAMEILLELQDMARFRRADELAAYVGLTPSQYSSGENVRMGHITRAGKASVRAALVEASWVLVRKDDAMRMRYDGLKVRAGGKRAIVAVAHNFLLRLRRMLLDGRPYVFGLVRTQ